MRIHATSPPIGVDAPSSPAAEAVPPCDYFYNYYSLGVDLLMDGRTGMLVKAVVHNNTPGGREFGQYKKCDFVLLMKKGGGSGGRSGGSGVEGEKVVGVGSATRWVDVERIIKDCGGCVSRGMLNGGGEKAVNPFGSTMIYATRGVLV